MTVASIASGQDDAAAIVAQAQSLKVVYIKSTPNKTESYWNVAFTGDEIRTIDFLLKHARRRVDGRNGWFINAIDGEFSTSKQSFDIRIGDEKVATRPITIVLTDKKTKSKQVYELLDEDAEDFRKLFEAALVEKTRNTKPDRIEQR